MQAIVIPRNNLDLLMLLSYDFRTAVAILARWLDRYQARLPKTSTAKEAK